MSDTLRLHSGWDHSTIISDLKEAKLDSKISNLTMYNLRVEETLVTPLKETLCAQGKRWNTIEILGCNGRIDRLIDCIFTLPHVQELILQHNHYNLYDLSVYVALGMGLSSSGSVQVLRLYQPDLSCPSIWALGQGLRSNTCLQELDFNCCRLDSAEVADTLAAALSTNTELCTILWNDCQLNDNNAATLLRSLEHHPKLECLEISRNQVGSNASTALAAFLGRSNCPLRKLDLHCQRIRQGERLLHMADSALCESLRINSSLQMLNLSGNKLDDDDMHSISLILQQSNTALLELDLSNNRITDQGIKQFATALPCCRVLKRLSFQANNKVSDEGGQAIATAMRDNMELEEINIKGTKISPKVVKDIQFYSSLNRGGRKLLQTNNCVPQSLWPIVFARVVHKLDFTVYYQLQNAKVDVIYCLLQGPALLEQRS